MSDYSNTKLVKVGGAWAKIFKSGPGYSISINDDVTITGGSLLMFTNKYKEKGDNKPDFTVNMSVPDEGEEQDTSFNYGKETDYEDDIDL